LPWEFIGDFPEVSDGFNWLGVKGFHFLESQIWYIGSLSLKPCIAPEEPQSNNMLILNSLGQP
jgi:hypothetical protein